MLSIKDYPNFFSSGLNRLIRAYPFKNLRYVTYFRNCYPKNRFYLRTF
jgi:hypothetical protein